MFTFGAEAKIFKKGLMILGAKYETPYRGLLSGSAQPLPFGNRAPLRCLKLGLQKLRFPKPFVAFENRGQKEAFSIETNDQALYHILWG